jgi:hypothetical protein
MRNLLVLAAVLGAVAAALAAVEAALVALPLEVLRFPPALVVDRHGQIATTRPPAGGPWILVLGGSTAEDGFDLARLGVPARALTQGFGYPSDTALRITWVIRHLPPAQRPALVVWGLNRVSFLDRHPAGAGDACDTVVASRMYLRDVADPLGLCPDEGPLPTRIERFVRTRSPWIGARDLVLDRLLVVGRGALFGDEATNKLEPQRFRSDFVNEADRQALRRANVLEWTRFSVFRHGPLDPRQVRALRLVADECVRRDLPLVLVSMPEHSTCRRRYTPEARRQFGDLLASVGMPVLDFYALLPDSDFVDQAHADASGRAITTSALRERIHALLPALPDATRGTRP